MPEIVTLAILLVAKASSLAIGSKVAKHFGKDAQTAQALVLFKDGQVCLQEEESSKVASCNAIALVGSQTMEQSLPIVEKQPCPQAQAEPSNVSSSNVNVIVTCGSRSIVESSTSMDLVSVKNANNFSSSIQTGSLELFAFWCWYLARIITVMQSASRSVIIDLKEAMYSLFWSESLVEMKANASVLFLMSASWFLTKIVNTLKETARILMSQAKQNLSTIFGLLFPIKRRVRQSGGDLLQVDTSTESSTAVDVGKSMLSSLMMFIASVKQVVGMLFKRSYHRGMSALWVMLFVSAFMGLNTPLKLVDIDETRGSPVHDILSSTPARFETSTDFGVNSLVSVSPLMISSPGFLSNGVDSSTSGSAADLYSVSTDIQVTERSSDRDASYPSSLSVWSNDQGTDSFSQSISHLNTEVLAVSVTWQSTMEMNIIIILQEWGHGDVLSSRGLVMEQLELAAVDALDFYIAVVNMKDISLQIIWSDRLYTEFLQSIETEVVSQVPWNVESFPQNSDPLKDWAQLGMSLSAVPALNTHPFDWNKVQLVAKASIDVHKAGSSSLLLDPIHLALILLVLCISRGSDLDSNGTQVTLVSEIQTSFNAIGDEVMNVDEWNESEEDRHITAVKPARRVSKELYSELGKHWTSPSKRRRRRSSRTCSKPKYYQPAWE